MDENTVLASGNGWTLYDDGTLVISQNWNTSYDYPSESSPPWYSNRSSITKVQFTGTVTNIRNYAFYGCTSLTEITIPDEVTRIGTYAFYGCTSLTEITIPEGVTMLRSQSFNTFSTLKVVIPTTVSTIYRDAFNSSRMDSYSIYYNGTKKQLDDIEVMWYVTYYGNYYSTVGKLNLFKNAFVGVHGLASITIASPPTKTSYDTGETVDGSGLSVIANYNTGYSDSYSQAISDYVLLPERPIKSSDTVITVSYTDLESGSNATSDIEISVTHRVSAGYFPVEVTHKYNGVTITTSFMLTMHSS